MPRHVLCFSRIKMRKGGNIVNEINFSPKNHFFQIPVKIHLSRSKFIIEFEFAHYKMTKQIISE